MDALGAFLQNALKSPALSRGAIQQLSVRAQGGSFSAREQLVRAHLKLVLHVAGCFYKPGCFCELGDLIQQGCLGLLHAITKFDPRKQSKGRAVQFSTYAHYWVTHYIRREIENNGRTIAIPVHRLREMRGKGSHPLDLPTAYSLDQSDEWAEDPQGVAFARLMDPTDTSDRWCEAWETRRQMERLLKSLSPRKREVLKFRYGLDDAPGPHTQRQVGERLGVSTTSIGFLERSALYEIRELASQLKGVF